MSEFLKELQARLDAIRQAGLYRELRRLDSAQGTRVQFDGRTLRNFSSNDYLGLANEPSLREAAQRAIRDYGAGSGASRLISGSLAPHHELEEALAEFKGTEAALAFSSGYVAAFGVVGALVQKADVVVLDKLVHASLVDAARLSGATLRVFDHNDLNDLERILKWTLARPGTPGAASRVWIATDSVFSMEGDLAPLRELVELKDRYGAWLILDEAHATGLFGERRRGLAEAFGLEDRIEVQMGTLGKALGAAGGFVAGPRALINLLINRARSFILSTAPTPAAAASATAAVKLVQSPEGETRRTRLWARVDQLKNGLVGGPWTLPVVRSAILPVIVGAEDRAVRLADQLRERGVFVPAIRYPAVARGAARLRVTATAAHTADDVKEFLATVKDVEAANERTEPIA